MFTLRYDFSSLCAESFGRRTSASLLARKRLVTPSRRPFNEQGGKLLLDPVAVAGFLFAKPSRYYERHQQIVVRGNAVHGLAIALALAISLGTAGAATHLSTTSERGLGV